MGTNRLQGWRRRRKCQSTWVARFRFILPHANRWDGRPSFRSWGSDLAVTSLSIVGVRLASAFSETRRFDRFRNTKVHFAESFLRIEKCLQAIYMLDQNFAAGVSVRDSTPPKGGVFASPWLSHKCIDARGLWWFPYNRVTVFRLLANFFHR